MVNTIEITIIVIIIQIIYRYINLFIFKNKPKSYELLTDKIIRTLEENNKEHKKKISSLETLIIEISEKNNNEHKKKISSLETLIVEIIVENEKAFEKIEKLEKNDRINKETIKENNNSLETLITEKIKTLEKNIDNEIKIIDYEFERIINEYCIGNNDKITLRVEELEKYVDEIDEHHEELSSTSSSRIDSMLNDIDRIRKPDSFTPVSTGNDNRVLSTNTDGVVGTIEFPRGMIISWIPPQYINTDNDEENRIRPPAPAGWAYCDGTNGTPDLRCRYLVGMGYEDEKMMVNMREEAYEPYIQNRIEAYKKNPTDPNLVQFANANIQSNPPYKNFPDIMHNNMANNNINYMVGFSYNNGVYCRDKDYNNDDFVVAKVIPKNYRNDHQPGVRVLNDKEVWHKSVTSKHDGGKTWIHLPQKLIYKPEYVNYPTDNYFNADGVSYSRTNSLKLNENLRTAVYYLMKL